MQPSDPLVHTYHCIATLYVGLDSVSGPLMIRRPWANTTIPLRRAVKAPPKLWLSTLRLPMHMVGKSVHCGNWASLIILQLSIEFDQTCASATDETVYIVLNVGLYDRKSLDLLVISMLHAECLEDNPFALRKESFSVHEVYKSPPRRDWDHSTTSMHRSFSIGNIWSFPPFFSNSEPPNLCLIRSVTYMSKWSSSLCFLKVACYEETSWLRLQHSS